tara:strand:- start:1 stop:294 length:294 start_codon:yes stop_codon:yes gene_type:complete
MAAVNKEICDRLSKIESRLPQNGELREIHETVKEIKKILLDPEDGIVVRVNQNTYWRRQIDAIEFRTIVQWKKNMTHAMWIAYSVILGIIIKLFING